MNPNPKHCLLLLEYRTYIPPCIENGGRREQAEGEKGEVQQAAAPRPGRRYRLHQREEHEVQPEAREVRYSPSFCRNVLSSVAKLEKNALPRKIQKENLDLIFAQTFSFLYLYILTLI
jgi:hypothetical protein